jgi:molybdopterin-guanine dinucleotide biosynthesis protein A
MPFVSPELIRNMLQRKEEGKISIAQYSGKIYPVLGIYPYAVLVTASFYLFL